MNRRGFLGTLIAGTAGLFLPSDALWLPPADIVAPTLAPGAIIGLRRMTMEVAHLLSQQIQGRISKGDALGVDGLMHQYNIDLLLPLTLDHHGLDSDRYLRHAAMSLATRLQDIRATTFGELRIPVWPEMAAPAAAQRVSGNGVSVRGIQMYDPDLQGDIVRFDVLAG